MDKASKIESIVLDNVLDRNDLKLMLDLYHNSTNQVDLGGEIIERHSPTNIGYFRDEHNLNEIIPTTPMLSKFSLDEVQCFWNKLEARLSAHMNDKTFEFCRCRVFKYMEESKIPAHTDTPISDGANYGIVIPLNNPREYKGGVILTNILLYQGQSGVHLKDYRILSAGDAVGWDYFTQHEVSTITHGTRYVINFRLIVKDKT